MKKSSRILVGVGCFALLLISWLVVASTKSNLQKQLELIGRAALLMNDGIYVRAVPLLEEATGYNTAATHTAEEELKKAYIALINTRGYSRKYTSLLETQMNRAESGADVYLEAANYYLGISKISDALNVLKKGIEKTGSEQLIALYERNRYAYETNRTTYDYVAAISGGAVQVRLDGLWGLATADGIPIIPCEYEKISTYSVDRVIVKKRGEIYAVNRDNNRVARPNENISDFGNFANDRIPLFTVDGWKRATGEFTIGSTSFKQLGMCSEGLTAAKTSAGWGVVDLKNDWLIPAEYDEIMQDELRRCYSRGAVFARKGGSVFLFLDGRQTGEMF
ncbi:MAG: WG repeat-containing protein, partial [Oscillospiraceae bacterium]|nr:WG repeat-containing protein [Oscillospiraceae bacterium]